MGVVGLGWCISGLLALLAVMTSAITWAPPGPGPVERALPAAFGGGALLMAGLSFGLGLLPPTHWLRLSRSVRAGFAVAAATVAVLVALLG